MKRPNSKKGKIIVKEIVVLGYKLLSINHPEWGMETFDLSKIPSNAEITAAEVSVVDSKSLLRVKYKIPGRMLWDLKRQ